MKKPNWYPGARGPVGSTAQAPAQSHLAPNSRRPHQSPPQGPKTLQGLTRCCLQNKGPHGPGHTREPPPLHPPTFSAGPPPSGGLLLLPFLREPAWSPAPSSPSACHTPPTAFATIHPHVFLLHTHLYTHLHTRTCTHTPPAHSTYTHSHSTYTRRHTHRHTHLRHTHRHSHLLHTCTHPLEPCSHSGSRSTLHAPPCSTYSPPHTPCVLLQKNYGFFDFLSLLSS